MKAVVATSLALVLVAFLIFSSVLGGLAWPDGQEHPPQLTLTLPHPREGERVTYASQYSTHDGRTQQEQVVLSVGKPIVINDIIGGPTSVIPLTYEISRVYPDGGRFGTRFTEFVAADGTRVLAISACNSIGGAYWPADYSCETAQAHYHEYGLPAGLGTSWFWGTPIRSPEVSTSLSLLGTPHLVSYAVQPTPHPGDDHSVCVRLEVTTHPELDLDGQRYSRFNEAPLALVLCEHSAFPIEVTFNNTKMTRQDHRPGNSPAIPPFQKVPSPFGLPAAHDARPLSHGFPSHGDWDPTGFALSEAFTHATRKDPEGKRFTDEHEKTFLRLTRAEGGNPPGGAFRDLGLSAPQSHQAHHVITMEGDNGEYLTLHLQKQCRDETCNIVTASRERGIVEPSLHEPESVVSRPLASLVAVANESLRKPVTWYHAGTVTTDVDRPPHGTRDRYLYWLFGDPEGSFGVPLYVRMDGMTGAVLAMHAPREAVLERTGVPARFVDPGWGS